MPHFTSVILKLTSFCNLNCRYCYMFNLADRTFERMPKHMPLEVSVAALQKLCLHVISHGGKSINIVLHGGEPTLWPIAHFKTLFGEIRLLRGFGLDVRVSLQSNGYLIQRELAELLMQNDVVLGFSLDGPADHNDVFRVTHSGAGSYGRILENMTRVLEWGYEKSKFGVLCVANPKISPDRFLGWAASLPLNSISVLWPIEFSWSNPPWRTCSEASYAIDPVYGRWMADAFEQWWSHYVDQLHVWHFTDTIRRMLGSRNHSDSIGNDFVDMFVVNCDGGIEYSDYLRAHVDGGSRTSYSIYECDLDEVARDPTFDALLHLRSHLPTKCTTCRHCDLCGGGFLAGRSDERGFTATRRSVLCHDHLFYFDAVQRLVNPYLVAMS